MENGEQVEGERSPKKEELGRRLSKGHIPGFVGAEQKSWLWEVEAWSGSSLHRLEGWRGPP